MAEIRAGGEGTEAERKGLSTYSTVENREDVYNFEDAQGEIAVNVTETVEGYDTSIVESSTTAQDFELGLSDDPIGNLGGLGDWERCRYDFSACTGDLPVSDYSAVLPSSPADCPNPRVLRGRGAPTPLSQLRRSNGHLPKKAYFRIMLIRAFKKSLQLIPTRKWPKAGIFKLNKHNSRDVGLWSDYYSVYKQLKVELSDECREMARDNTEKSYGNEYCRRFFESETVRQLYHSFLGLVFHKSPDELCEAMKLRCCEHGQHSLDCQEVWRAVKRYAQVGLLGELQLEAWDGRQWTTEATEDIDEFLIVNP